MVFLLFGMMKDNFDFTPYKQTCWRCKLHRTSWGELRFVVFVSTGRKEWVLCSVVPTFTGLDDPAIKQIEQSIKYYTFPTIDRFVGELEEVLSGLYGVKIKFKDGK